ncbi:uncharacterized protein DUF3859 [Hasllibacter halocynthiae]|uniref:Uncharacterized protein DUF3859 n=1 Tax=Hasllibacter halocynthiae TaxID=595589 RepID=A0A2T0X3E4_9RHOB|nr:DUF3859 domain-containing protein [Hasllibacter halocynthiae]PRY93437.1 uncharacterized protein DUF3859 [Hasllibacter halocynthiae]
MRAARALALLAALAGPAAAEIRFDPAVVTGLRAGLWCASDTGERQEAPGTVSGYIDLVADPVLRRATEMVPLSSGTTFGIEATFASGVSGTAQVIVTHPPFGGSGETRQAMNPHPAAGRAIAFYTFDYPHEEVAGAWGFTLLLDGREVARAAFEAVEPRPGAMPLVGCGAPELLS